MALKDGRFDPNHVKIAIFFLKYHKIAVRASPPDPVTCDMLTLHQFTWHAAK